uniref:Uncharacterized protein n=1 Tax=Parascaris equorum TaxID=6256 RepID=A0A914RTP4_PAREQ
MGSTRFMKVARAEHVEGAALVKVFLLHDQSFSIEPYRDQVSLQMCTYRQICYAINRDVYRLICMLTRLSSFYI